MQAPKIKIGTLLTDGKQKWKVDSINRESVTLRKHKGESKKVVSFVDCEKLEICDVVESV